MFRVALVTDFDVAHATCKLDNLNSLLTGPYMDTKLNRLQLIQNHAARIITRTKKV